MRPLEYKGYVGSVQIDTERNVLYGTVQNIRDVIHYEADSVAALQQAFRESVDDYLEFCKERSESPEKPFSGKFQLRIPPTLHREVFIASSTEEKSINSWVQEVLEAAVGQKQHRARKKQKKPNQPRQGRYQNVTAHRGKKKAENEQQALS
jgi:predicted HicB family RNase H-like nuclease